MDGNMRKLTVIGCVMWIAGLAASIIGMNLKGPEKGWVSIVGNVVFFVGLGIMGFVWMKRKKDEEEKDAESK